MKKVYIASPLRGNEEENIKNAIEYSRYAIMECGVLPQTPHIFLTRFLDDNVEEERALGIKAGMQLLEECDELWVFGDVISEGMQAEIARAQVLGIPIEYIDGSDLLMDNQMCMGVRQFGACRIVR
jgi:hypothetical protein